MDTSVINNYLPSASATSLGVTIIMWLIFIVALIGFVYGFFWFFKNYCVKTLIFEKRGNGVIVIKTKRMRWVEKNGLIYGKFFLNKEMIKPPKDFNSVYRVGKNDMVILYKPNPTTYCPINISDDGMDFDIVPDDVKLWHVETTKTLHKDFVKPDFMTKYGTIINLGVIIIIIIMMILLFREFKVIASAFSGAADKCLSGQIIK